jgi:hypothetical protein
MKKITIFAFIGFVFVAGMFFSSKAQAAEAAAPSGQQISAEEAKILKQTLDVLEIVLKNVESKVKENGFTPEKKILVNESLTTIEGSLVRVDYMVKNYAGDNYPGSGSLYAESGSQKDSQKEADAFAKQQNSPKSGLASLWATIWPWKLIGVILLAAAVFILGLNFRGKKEQATT